MDLMSEFDQPAPKPVPKVAPRPAAAPVVLQSKLPEPDYQDDDDVDLPYEDEDVDNNGKMFELLQADTPNDTGTKIVHFTASGGVRFCVSDDGKLHALNDDGKILYYSSRQGFTRVFVDTEGKQILACSGTELYTADVKTDFETGKEKKDKIKGDPRKASFGLKAGDAVTAAVWDKKRDGWFLCGTKSGLIIFMTREKDHSYSGKILCNLAEKASDPEPGILGLELERFPKRADKLVVIVTTRSRIYQFVGKTLSESLFDLDLGFTEMPRTEKGESKGSISLARGTSGIPIAYAWLIDIGIVHGRLTFTKPRDVYGNNEEVDTDKVIHDQHRIPNDTLDGSGPIQALVITEYHFFIQYSNKLIVLGHPPGMSWMSATEPSSKLKKSDIESRVVHVEDKCFRGANNNAIGLCIDQSTKTIYIVTPNRVFEIMQHNPERNVWAKFLERAVDPREQEREEYFRRALHLCREDPVKTEKILRAKGEYHFAMKQYIESGKVFAWTTRSFEEVCLLFINLDNQDALLHYLLQRLECMKKRVERKLTQETQESKQLTCICTWVTQLFLDRMHKLSNEEPDDEKSPMVGKSMASRPQPQYQTVTADFRKFLENYQKDLSQCAPIIFNLISSQGRIDEVLLFAEIIQDYERVINYHIISKQDYNAAVNVLITKVVRIEHEELWYRFSPLLIQHCPKKLVDGWMMTDIHSWLKPAKIIPALVKYEKSKHNPKADTENHVIRYLTWLIFTKETKDVFVHNMLISFYCQQADETSLLQFLDRSDQYDPKYALRLCQESNRMLSCVYIYNSMKLYEDAVRTALQINNLHEAMESANKPSDEDKQMSKKLWLEIARYCVKRNVREAIELLSKTKAIQLEDILPFFPDFVLIQDFKGEICQSLEDYNSQIQELKYEMDEATNNADAIRQSINELRHRYGYITSQQPCDCCGQPVLNGDFYLFPSCRHVFGKDCLASSVEEYLKEKKRRDSAFPIDKDKMSYREWDEYVQRECIYCGDMMIDSVAWGFPSAGEASWAVENTKFR